MTQTEAAVARCLAALDKQEQMVNAFCDRVDEMALTMDRIYNNINS